MIFLRPSRKPGVSYEKKVTAVGWIAAVATVAFLGTTLASNISLNSDQSIEFGQGVAQTTSCDSSVIVTPTSTFNSSTNTFVLDQIDISDIAQSCMGDKFTVNVYQTGHSEPLNGESIYLEFAGNAGDGNSFADGHWDNALDIKATGADIASALIDTSHNGLDGEMGKTEVAITGITTDGTVAVDAESVDRITIESKVSTYLRSDFQTLDRGTLFGGNGGGPFTENCPAHKVIKSVTFADYPWEGDGWYGYMSINCVDISTIDNPGTDVLIVDTSYYDPSTNVSTCSTGKVGNGLKVMVEATFATGVAISCDDYPTPGTAETGARLGNDGGGGVEHSSACAAGSWMTGVYGRNGQGMDSLGAVCTPQADL